MRKMMNQPGKKIGEKDSDFVKNISCSNCKCETFYVEKYRGRIVGIRCSQYFCNVRFQLIAEIQDSIPIKAIEMEADEKSQIKT